MHARRLFLNGKNATQKGIAFLRGSTKVHKMQPYLLGLDLGSTNIKALAITREGRVVAQADRPTRTLLPQPGWVEQDPRRILSATVSVLREAYREAQLAGGTLQGVVCSGAMHSVLAIDYKGSPLTNAWLWSDTRSAHLADAVRGTDWGLKIYRQTGVPIHAMSPLFKIQWLKQHCPEVASVAFKYLGIKEFVLGNLLGLAPEAWVSDVSVASATGLLNTQTQQWDAEALALADLTTAQLPRVVASTEVFYLPENFFADRPQKTALVVGASDGALANLGSGAEGAESLAVTIGTSGAVRLLVEEPYFDPTGRTFCYRLDERRLIVGGASNNGANALEWLRKSVLRTRRSLPDLLAEAALVPPGAEGLVFEPFLHGERAPLWDAHATASFRGLTARHSQAHLTRAVLEGVAANLKSIADLLPTLGQVQRIVLSGGVARNALWVNVLEQAFRLPVEVPEGGDASARGAVLLGWRALKF
jgi:gluconokinase